LPNIVGLVTGPAGRKIPGPGTNQLVIRPAERPGLPGHRVTVEPVTPAAAAPAAVYAGRLIALRAEGDHLARRHARLARWGRRLTGALVLLLVLAERERVVTKVVLVVPPAALVEYLIRRRARVAGSIRASDWLTGLYEQRLACVEDP
jgi:hypothetical protein